MWKLLSPTRSATVCHLCRRSLVKANSLHHPASLLSTSASSGNQGGGNKPKTIAEQRAAAAKYLTSLGKPKAAPSTQSTNSSFIQGNKNGDGGGGGGDSDDAGLEKQAKLSELRDERAGLWLEASFLSRMLYRVCLRSVQLLRPGNEEDHREFDRREQEQFESTSNLASEIFSATPPVDRENELESRYEYYYSFLRENFEQDGTCLDREPYWMEDDLQKYVNSMRYAEHSRKFLLQDYKFEDPYNGRFDPEQLDRLEKRMDAHIKSVFQLHGWHHSSDATEDDELDEDVDEEEDLDDRDWK